MAKNIDITITEDSQALAEAMKQTSDRVERGVLLGVRDALNIVERQALTQHLTGGTTSKRLGVRSGVLRNSITKRIARRSGEIIGIIGTGVVYAKVHEPPDGSKQTTIRAKRSGGHLTIPLSAALTAAGVARWTARELIASPSRGGFESTFFSKRSKIIFGVKGEEIVPLFVLKRSVTIKARPFLSSSLREKAVQVENAIALGMSRAGAL